MTISDVIAGARYWERLADLLEDQEDQAVLKVWLAERAAGSVERLSLDDLERELMNNGRLPLSELE